MKRFVLSLLAIVAVPAASALAHPGTRVYVANEGGQIKTYLGSPNDDQATGFQPKRVFAEPLPEFTPDSGLYLTDFPGFQVNEAQGGIGGGTNFSFTIAGPLRYFDYDSSKAEGTYRTVAEQFSPGTVPQMALVQTNKPTAVTSSGAVAGYDFFTHNGSGDHGHVFFSFYGNGTALSDGPGGIYALPLTLHASGLTQSDPFWILFGKDRALGTTEFNTAISAAEVQLVPEPGFVGVAGLAAVALLARRRNRGGATR